MKFKQERPFANPEAAVKRLLEIANGLDARLRRAAPGARPLRGRNQCCGVSLRELLPCDKHTPGAGTARRTPTIRDRCARPAGVTGGSFR
jgi:hypothetical protein